MKLLAILLLALLSTFAHGDNNENKKIKAEFTVSTDEAGRDACKGFERIISRALERKIIKEIEKFEGVKMEGGWKFSSHSQEGDRRLRSRKLWGSCRGSTSAFCMWLRYGSRRQLTLNIPKGQDHRELEDAVCTAVRVGALTWLFNERAQAQSRAYFATVKPWMQRFAPKLAECAQAIKLSEIETDCELD